MKLSLPVRGLLRWGHGLFWLFVYVNDLIQALNNQFNKAPIGSPAYIPVAVFGYVLIPIVAFYGAYLLIYKPLTKKIGLAIVGMAATVGLVVLARFVIEFGVLKPFLNYDNYSRDDQFTWAWFAQNAILYYWNWVVYGVLYGFAERYFLDQQQQRQREQELTRSEAAFLRSQLNPHFLFNALNDVYALALTRPAETPAALLQLADLLRYMLYSSQAPTVALADELDYLNGFLALEQMGKSGQTTVQNRLTGHVNGQRIAPMLLIPFVENALKHGDATHPTNPISIETEVADNQLLFRCQNAKQAGLKDKTGGIGLANLQRRLALEYPNRHTLTIQDLPDQFAVYLTLDLTPA